MREMMADRPLGLLKKKSLWDVSKRGRLLIPHQRPWDILKFNRVMMLRMY